MPEDCMDCKFKDLELTNNVKEITDLGSQLEEEKAKHAFGSFPEVLAHAKGGSCPSCKTALESMDEDMARTTLTEIDDKTLLALAVSRGVLPETITVQVPMP